MSFDPHQLHHLPSHISRHMTWHDRHPHTSLMSSCVGCCMTHGLLSMLLGAYVESIHPFAYPSCAPTVPSVPPFSCMPWIRHMSACVHVHPLVASLPNCHFASHCCLYAHVYMYMLHRHSPLLCPPAMSDSISTMEWHRCLHSHWHKRC